MKKAVKNPLRKRILRELAGDWRKYLVIILFLILTIGFVSGMYVANGSMLNAARSGVEKYKLEYGHFQLKNKADNDFLAAVETGEKADVKKYYTDKARKELDEEFDGEFKKEFDKEFKEEFDSEFKSEFDKEFEAGFREQVKAQILLQVPDEAMAEVMTDAAIEQAKQSGDYKTAYDKAFDEAYSKAYEEAYKTAYDKAYPEAYDKAWEEIEKEIDEEYDEAVEKFKLDEENFNAVPVKIYENFFKNAEEDNNCDGEQDGGIRVFEKTEDVNLACLMEGEFPQNEKEIAIDRMHADNAGITVGDEIKVEGESFTVSGLLAYVNFSTLHEKNSDFMFDALNFDVGMVTDKGFDRIKIAECYSYAWQYENSPADDDEKAEKVLSDNFLKVLATQSAVYENEIEDFLPRYGNQAVQFAPDDMAGDESMGEVILIILIAIIAFIFAVTISGTIVKESSAIGTLRASGYTKGELIRHYISMPVIVTLFGAAVGNILGYTVFKNVVVAMYYNSYSLPTYVTVWNPEAFVKTTAIPILFMIIINLIVIIRSMNHTPLQFLQQDLKKKKRKKALRLPKWKFIHRFRLRIIFQNIPNYIILLAGVFFISLLLSMAVGMPDTLAYYKSNAKNMMFADYQYILTSFKDDEDNIITTENSEAERFAMTNLQRKSEALNEDISVYGISSGSKYVKIDGLSELTENQVYISSSYHEKYRVNIGDSITLDEKYDYGNYSFTVAGIFDGSPSLAVFMPIENYRKVFKLEKDEFTGYMTNTEISDIDEESIATVITERDITKICDQLDHSMGSVMEYFQVLCILLSAVLIYLLSKIIIEKNENAISMTKILGYKNGEVAGLYMASTAIILVISDLIGTFFGSKLLAELWGVIMSEYSGWFAFTMQPAGLIKIFGFILLGYLLVTVFDFLRIKRIPLGLALKNAE